MNDTILHRRRFLLHLQRRTGFAEPVVLKEPARERPSRTQLDQLHDEYAITRQLVGVAGVRQALAKEGSESRPVLVLQYVQGQSLAELIRTASHDLGERLRLAVNLARVLGRVHDRGVIHKDLNSSNVLVAERDAPGSQAGVYLIDFGLGSTSLGQRPSLLEADDSMIGSLAYVSPEQTGRMNRRLDFRTDLYSLGVTLYELFTGRLPFAGGDLLELIHDHVARPPRPPHEVEPAVPVPLSQVLLRLLAKDADDRYQTARGLQADLENCLHQWQRGGRIRAFELGRDDFTGRLQIPQRLYGRRPEIERLRNLLERAVTRQAQLALVAGYSGVGKTSLVRELQKHLIGKNGNYIEGKFDQFQRTRPYSAWEQALSGLVDRWLGQSPGSRARWRKTILNAVGPNGQVLIDLVPALERVLGPQPQLPELGSIENQHRVRHFFSRFIGCLARPEHPLMVFLDDLQWIDPASLELIEALFAGPASSGLLVVGAYRSNEVNAAHPLTLSQNRMLAESGRVSALSLSDLPPDAVNRLLADSLRIGLSDCRDLGQVLVAKTGGNPFFMRQLLSSLEDDGLLAFDRDRCRWTWPQDLGARVAPRGSVVDLMIGKIRPLAAATRHALSRAASLGNRFDLPTLSGTLGSSEAELLAALNPALEAGLIVPAGPGFAFSHDRVQEAAYALIPEPERPSLHLALGRSLLAAAGKPPREREIFDIVGHLNAGRTAIRQERERIELADLNLNAGKRAKSACAYADARSCVEIGLELLPADAWQGQYPLTLSLHNESGELAALTGSLEQVQATADLIYANAKSPLHRVRITMALIEAETMQYNPSRALELGLQALAELGIEIPLQPAAEYQQGLRRRLVDLLAAKPAQHWARQPQMSDRTALAASSLLASIMSTSYIVNPPLFPVISYQGALLTLEFGLDVWSPFFIGGVALVNTSLVQGTTPRDEAGELVGLSKRLLDIVCRMLDQPVTARSETKGLMMLAFVVPWMQPLEKGIDFARKTYLSGYRTGDTLYGSYGAFHFGLQTLVAGMNLVAYENQLSDYAEGLKGMGQVFTSQLLAIQLQFARNLRETVPDPHRLKGVHFDEDAWLPKAAASNDLAGRHTLSVCKLVLAYQFDADDLLEAYGREAEALLGVGRSLFTSPLFYLYFPLSRLRLLGSDAGRRAETLGLADDYLRLLDLWSEFAPTTFRHRYDLLAAEKARVAGDTGAAVDAYQQAIEGARASGCTHDEALANELYAGFWAARGNEDFAALSMREAHSLYRKWGAVAKAEHLAQRYPRWAVQRRILAPDPELSAGGDDLMTGDLDLRVILQASQDIAGETDLDSLLAKLMTDVLQYSGAQQGYLLREQAGEWMIEAEASADGCAPGGGAGDLANRGSLAQSAVHYVARTGETLVLDDACRSGGFMQDPYVRAQQARSILCGPLVNRGKISAILYLENDLAAGVFSPQRVSFLRALSSQMAISIDNARDHADLERLVEARSQALASAQAKIRTLFENSPLGIALTNAEGRFLSVNQAVLKMLCSSEQALLEDRVVDFCDDPSDRDALLRQLKDSGVVQDFGVQLVSRDGTSFYASLNMSKLMLEGKEVLLTMVQDVTDQITAEQETAVHEERARLARELHDAVSQTILSASLLADATARNWEEARAITTADLTKLSGMLRGALDEMRTLLFELRPAVSTQRTLGQLLGPLAETMRARSSTAIHLKTKGDHVLPEQVTTALHRIAQESLNNAVRHGDAGTIKIELVSDPDQVVLRIADDGLGFDVDRREPGHHGLNIMRERAEEIGAVFAIESCAGCGTQVTVTWS